ncbi:glycosyltransferase family 2 protein [Flavitalea sp. BT771]|uniref:glycosyltransferase family 2 protein n=1 Tax=Flavitalea sp. BT771 TaxID=3063329 RepID=UPI0026E3F276|nr:glycosyltransferase family 2 protein [Flavitalea sp. BT771]MDO6434155.1 glycosyltransferase family 2 protein [Flavitalea sp. BT771]MDV6223055.1 glycosyltransferase family 2 protein [Flavitalea sp. BT771]
MAANDQMNPLISVLMTSYNREKYIVEAIESVLASTFKDFELIVCDDVSKDKTVEIARQYAAKDPRIRVYVNETNLGDYPNRNKAASYARGKYLKYQDSDDLIYPHSLEIMVNVMEKFPEAAFAFCGNEVQDDSSPYPILYNSYDAYRQHFFGMGGLFYAGPVGTIIRRSAFEEAGRFSGRRYIGDAEMWMKFALNHPVVKMQPGLIWWRTHPGQEFSMGSQEYALLRFDLDREILNNPLCPLSEKERKAALGNSRRLMGRKILGLLGKMNFSAAVQLSRKAGVGPLSLVEAMIPVNKMKGTYRKIVSRQSPVSIV